MSMSNTTQNVIVTGDFLIKNIIELKEELFKMKMKMEKMQKILDKKTMGLEIMCQKKNSVVLSLTTTLQKNNHTVVWNKNDLPIDEEFFSKSNDNKIITVKKKGFYRIDLQLLPVSGNVCYPFIQINGANLKYGYSDAKGYTCATMNYTTFFPDNSKVIIGLQSGSGNLYVSNGVHHYLNITKV